MNGSGEYTNGIDGEHHAPDLKHASQLDLVSGQPPPAIAIIGMGMRLPGGVRTAEDFWKLLIEGRDGYGPLPKSRYDNEASDIENQEDEKGSTAAQSQIRGYFLHDNLAHFDARFFNIADHHAALTDPQQRLLQEVAWDCLENAGQINFRGKEIGCFVGVFGNDWQELSTIDKQGMIGKQVVGSQDFFVANQVSQVLEITGPRYVRRRCDKSHMWS